MEGMPAAHPRYFQEIEIAHLMKKVFLDLGGYYHFIYDQLTFKPLNRLDDH